MMFIIELVYKADLADIDAAMKAHMAFVRTHYSSGTFVLSGRKVPRDGGIILAVGQDRASIEAIANADPFVVEGLADVRVIEFRASQHAKNIDELVEKHGS